MLLKEEINKTPTLPNIPHGVPHLLKALNQGDIHFIKLAKEIEKFPNIAIKIISVANSAWFAPVCPITNLLDACSRLGLNTVRSISFALSIADIFDSSRCTEFDIKFFWRTALLNAEAASLCAEYNNSIDVQNARTAGLFYNIGLLWLADNKPEETGRAISTAKGNPSKSLSDCLYDELFTDHHITGGMLAQLMGLPHILVNAISSSHIKIADKNAPLESNTHNAHQLVEKALDHANHVTHAVDEKVDDEILLTLLNRMESIEAVAEVLFNSSK